MKKTSFLYPALACALLFFLASFIGVAWYSDDRGLLVQIGLNIGTKNGAFSTLSDLVFTLAPLFALISLFFSRFLGKEGARFCLCLHALPTALYALMELILFLTVKEGHFSLVLTYLLILLLAAMAVCSAFVPELAFSAKAFCLFYVAAETLLAVLSLALGEKLSTFVFSQAVPFNKTELLHVSYVVVSMFVYFAAYALSLFFHLKSREESFLP